MHKKDNIDIQAYTILVQYLPMFCTPKTKLKSLKNTFIISTVPEKTRLSHIKRLQM